jgi:hypothetical protein
MAKPKDVQSNSTLFFVFLLSTLVRLALFKVPAIASLLEQRIEISSTTTKFRGRK